MYPVRYMTGVSVNLTMTYFLGNKHVTQWINLLRLELESCQFNHKY